MPVVHVNMWEGCSAERAKAVIQGIAGARETTFEAIVETVEANLRALAGDDPWSVEAPGL